MYIYLITPDGKKPKIAKIGRTKNLEKRLKQLQTGHPGKLEVFYSIPCKSEANAVYLERCIHKEFEHLRISGEWFKLTANLRKYLEGIKEHDVEKQDRALFKHSRQVSRGHFDWKTLNPATAP